MRILVVIRGRKCRGLPLATPDFLPGAVGEGAVDFRPLDQDIAHAALIELTEKLRERRAVHSDETAR
jgi:hypothetical protein